ncbi:hypothetical protein KBC99_01965 [Candidatus Saccharibacteria bacterium]|nr:hypothetical protein [Candidatus Saccharibacteria bacterium]
MRTFHFDDITGFAIERRIYRPEAFRYMKVPAGHLTDNVFVDLGKPVRDPEFTSETFINTQDEENNELIRAFRLTQEHLTAMVDDKGWLFDEGCSALMPHLEADFRGFCVILLHIILPSEMVHWTYTPFHIRAELVARSRGHQLRLGTAATPDSTIQYTIDCACGLHLVASTEYQLHGIEKLTAELSKTRRAHFADCLNQGL